MAAKNETITSLDSQQTQATIRAPERPLRDLVLMSFARVIVLVHEWTRLGIVLPEWWPQRVSELWPRELKNEIRSIVGRIKQILTTIPRNAKRPRLRMLGRPDGHMARRPEARSGKSRAKWVPANGTNAIKRWLGHTKLGSELMRCNVM